MIEALLISNVVSWLAIISLGVLVLALSDRKSTRLNSSH